MTFATKKDRKRTNPVWKRATVATMAAAMLVGGASGAFADSKGHGNGNAQGHSQEAKAKGKIELNLNFSDLKENDWKWAYEHIIRLASKQVFNGYEDGSFKPANSIKRIEAIVAAVRLLGLKDEAESDANMNAQLNFKDFDQIKKKYPWAVGYLKVALENDLFAEGDTSVQPDKPADRLWATVLLVKALKLDGEAKTKMDAQLTFKDEDKIPAGSVGYVAEALDKGLITGYSNNTFQPNKPVTRAELAALLDRADGQMPDSPDSQAINGSVVSLSGSSLSVKKSDGTTVALTLDPNVFVFRGDRKVAASALVSGDQVLVRTYEGNVVFIEVTQAATAPVTTTDTGTVSYYTLNSNQLATLTLSKVGSDGTSQSVLYNVADNVVVTGGNLAQNQTVTVTITNNVVTGIAIQS
ncbi:S-layer homology domain-containing protein [Cohnella zeiphila]|uniref:S-layer homology domain-containing protein n=1 Tax=Cohnella zeiphila TaxID=2761120 RepID=A0A7X0SM45_9BACL|nr:S-layer homology domain-containing protein [Cohnella zeiphila]MBB6732542.1 S-layer homology domain-containing protein [Cohnella zeiphila]